MNTIRKIDPKFLFMMFAGFITWFAVSAEAVLSQTSPRNQWIVAIGLLLFGILLSVSIYYVQQDKWSNRTRHLYFLVQGIILLIVLLVDPIENSGSATLFFVLCAKSMIFLPPKEGAIWIIIYTIMVMFIGYFFLDKDGWIATFTLIGGYSFFGTYGWLMRSAEEAKSHAHSLLEELQVKNEQLQELTMQTVNLAVAEERNRMAREMHDSLGHRMTASVLQLEGANRMIPVKPEQAQLLVQNVRSELRSGLQELRLTVSSLRTPMDEEGIALEQLVDSFSHATGLPIQFDSAVDVQTLPTAYRWVIYRAIQEGLTNIVRHAEATKAGIQLYSAEDTLHLLIEDNGAVGTPIFRSGHYGLAGIQERVIASGGQFQFGKRLNTIGSHLHLQFPLETT